MTIFEFEELLSRFDSLAKDTKVNLESMLSLISEGKVPLKNDIVNCPPKNGHSGKCKNTETPANRQGK